MFSIYRPLIMVTILVLVINNAFANCRGDILPDTPTENFKIYDNGTVIDTKTGLMWARCPLGQTWNGAMCIGSPRLYSWSIALGEIKRVNYGDYSDWRLPNVNELESIVERRCYEPAINSYVFPSIATGSVYWSSTPSGEGRSHAYTVSLGYDGRVLGIIGFGTELSVLFVRDEKINFYP